MVIRDGVIGVRPRQTVPEIKLFEIKGCHLLLKTVKVLFLVAINYSVGAFSRSCSL